MCIIQQRLLSKMEADNMTSQTKHHGGSSQLYPNQGFVKIKGATENVLSCLRALFQILSSICFCWELLFLYTITFMLTCAHGEEQTGVCKLLDPAIICDRSSAANPERIDLCPYSSTPMQWVNICILHGNLNIENHSPDNLRPLFPSRANLKMVVTVLAMIGRIGLVGRMLYKHCRPFTADINRGLMSEPTVARRSNPTFEILPRH